MQKVIVGKNGLKIVYKKVKDIEGVAVNIAFAAGSANDPRGKQGLAHFTEHCLANFSNEVFTKKELYANISYFPYKNAMTSVANMNFLGVCNRHDFEKLLNDLTSGFTKFTNIEKEIEEEKKVVVQEIATKRRSNVNQAFWQTLSNIRKEDNFKNLSEHVVLGSAEIVKNFTAKDVVEFKEKYFSLNNVTVGVVGNVSARRAKKVCEKFLCERLKKSGAKGFDYDDAKNIKGNVLVVDKPWEENKSFLRVIWKSGEAARYSSRRESYIRAMIRNVLNGMAFDKFRVENSSCYGVSFDLYRDYKDMTVDFVVECAHDLVEKNFNLFLEFIKDVKQNGLSKSFYDLEKQRYFNRKNIDRTSILNSAKSMLLAYDEYGKVFTKRQKEASNKKFQKITYEEINDYAMKSFVGKPNMILLTKDGISLDFDALKKVFRK